MFAGQFTREVNGVYGMATIYVNGDEMEVSIFENDMVTDEILATAVVKAKSYFRFDMILQMLIRGWA